MINRENHVLDQEKDIIELEIIREMKLVDQEMIKRHIYSLDSNLMIQSV